MFSTLSTGFPATFKPVPICGNRCAVDPAPDAEVDGVAAADLTAPFTMCIVWPVYESQH